MKSRDFCFWLSGHLNLSQGRALNAEQVKLIADKLQITLEGEQTDDRYLDLEQQARAMRFQKSWSEPFREIKVTNEICQLKEVAANE
jgi:hypothetical protein